MMIHKKSTANEKQHREGGEEGKKRASFKEFFFPIQEMCKYPNTSAEDCS